MRRALIAIALALSTAGCQLPGGSPATGGFTVSAEFTDVLDLVPQAAVKVNDVTVGSVTGVELHGWTAVVRMRVDDAVKLPDNAIAAIRQSSLLGEKFVDLAAPVENPQGTLGDGDVIPLERTKRGAEVEEVLAALGLLLNGGGLAQLKTINTEVGKALGGREADAKGALHELDKFVAALDQQKDDIVRALDALDRLTQQLAAQTDTIGRAVDALEPGLTVLAGQREQLTAALVALRDLGSVGKRVIDQSKADTLASLKALQPTLDQLVRAADALPKGLDMMLSYPFPPNVQKAIAGDYVRLHITLDLDAASILSNLVAKGTTPGTPTVPGLPPILPSLPPILPSLPPILPTALPSILPSGLLPSGLLPSGLLPGLPLSAPVVTWEYDPETGEIAGVTGGLQEILVGRPV
ncbi:MAG: MCE family protein [Hamadaea sp.]|uniref:MCE family protein n=1 Tax=Hamadaea sp. TaxID=2024425 RepID=UPI00178FB8EC|nr:MCE family protein [Hamadaea sp.]NUR69883.1 MCE family protein [Hamadaea sp.]NUT22079.1 MCE family protein [Hamadaea sp.]